MSWVRAIVVGLLLVLPLSASARVLLRAGGPSGGGGSGTVTNVALATNSENSGSAFNDQIIITMSSGSYTGSTPYLTGNTSGLSVTGSNPYYVSGTLGDGTLLGSSGSFQVVVQQGATPFQSGNQLIAYQPAGATKFASSDCFSGYTLSNGGLTIATQSGNLPAFFTGNGCRSTNPHFRGKWYFEVTYDSSLDVSPYPGLVNNGASVPVSGGWTLPGQIPGTDSASSFARGQSVGYAGDGVHWGAATEAPLPSWPVTKTMGVAIDLDTFSPEVWMTTDVGSLVCNGSGGSGSTAPSWNSATGGCASDPTIHGTESPNISANHVWNSVGSGAPAAVPGEAWFPYLQMVTACCFTLPPGTGAQVTFNFGADLVGHPFVGPVPSGYQAWDAAGPELPVPGPLNPQVVNVANAPEWKHGTVYAAGSRVLAGPGWQESSNNYAWGQPVYLWALSAGAGGTSGASPPVGFQSCLHPANYGSGFVSPFTNPSQWSGATTASDNGITWTCLTRIDNPTLTGASMDAPLWQNNTNYYANAFVTDATGSGYIASPTISFTGHISGATLTVDSGTPPYVGAMVYWTNGGVNAAVQSVYVLSGSGSTWTINQNVGTVSSQTISLNSCLSNGADRAHDAGCGWSLRGPVLYSSRANRITHINWPMFPPGQTGGTVQGFDYNVYVRLWYGGTGRPTYHSNNNGETNPIYLFDHVEGAGTEVIHACPLYASFSQVYPGCGEVYYQPASGDGFKDNANPATTPLRFNTAVGINFLNDVNGTPNPGTTWVDGPIYYGDHGGYSGFQIKSAHGAIFNGTQNAPFSYVNQPASYGTTTTIGGTEGALANILPTSDNNAHPSLGQGQNFILNIMEAGQTVAAAGPGQTCVGSCVGLYWLGWGNNNVIICDGTVQSTMTCVESRYKGGNYNNTIIGPGSGCTDCFGLVESASGQGAQISWNNVVTGFVHPFGMEVDGHTPDSLASCDAGSNASDVPNSSFGPAVTFTGYVDDGSGSHSTGNVLTVTGVSAGAVFWSQDLHDAGGANSLTPGTTIIGSSFGGDNSNCGGGVNCTGAGGTGTYKVSSSQLVYSGSPGTAESMTGRLCGALSGGVVNTFYGSHVTTMQVPGLSQSCGPSNNQLCDGSTVTGANSFVNPTTGSSLDARLGAAGVPGSGSMLYGAGSSGGSGGYVSGTDIYGTTRPQ